MIFLLRKSFQHCALPVQWSKLETVLTQPVRLLKFRVLDLDKDPDLQILIDGDL